MGHVPALFSRPTNDSPSPPYPLAKGATLSRPPSPAVRLSVCLLASLCSHSLVRVLVEEVVVGCSQEQREMATSAWQALWSLLGLRRNTDALVEDEELRLWSDSLVLNNPQLLADGYILRDATMVGDGDVRRYQRASRARCCCC